MIPNHLYLTCIGVGVFAICLLACSPNQESSQAIEQRFEDRTIYFAQDSSDVFWVKKLNDSLIKVFSWGLSKDFTLASVRSGSGTKYQDPDGYYFWSKANNFMWGKEDELMVTGTMASGQSGKQLSDSSGVFNKEHWGNYVSDGYIKRDEGHDWVAVSVRPLNRFRSIISVRSRADKKKPTCTLDAVGSARDQNTLVYYDDSLKIIFQFSQKALTIGTEPENHQEKLSWHCSGGGSLAGTYSKIEGALDAEQIDVRSYSKVLVWGDIRFFVTATSNTLTIKPSGLEIDNREIVQEFDGSITHTEIGDLNNDGHAELLVYLTSAGSGSYGSVIGYSVNNGKSMSQIYFPPLTDTQNEGYMGLDEFAIVESTLVRRFPIYKPQDANPGPTGGTRQIQYKLIDGEASRQFEVDQTLEY